MGGEKELKPLRILSICSYQKIVANRVAYGNVDRCPQAIDFPCLAERKFGYVFNDDGLAYSVRTKNQVPDIPVEKVGRLFPVPALLSAAWPHGPDHEV